MALKRKIDKIFEDYENLGELGQGGYAKVYKVRHIKLGYIRSIRVLNQVIVGGEDNPVYQKFLEECKILLRIGNGNHPNIVHIYQPLLRAQNALVEMDYVDGQDLAHYLKSQRNFVPVSDVLTLTREMSSALAYCHEDIYKFCMDRGIDGLKDDPNDGSKILLDEAQRKKLIEKYRVIHNDIHSGNIIRRENGSFVLLDFGLAIEGDKIVRPSQLEKGAMEFMAPEKWDKQEITPQLDIYSLGIVLYEYLTGRVPFVLDQSVPFMTALHQVMEAHKQMAPPPIFDLRKESFEATHPGEKYEEPDYPEWLEMLILKCLEKNPENRFADGKALFDYVQKHSALQSDGDISVLQHKLNELQNRNQGLSNHNEALQQQLSVLQHRLDELQDRNQGLSNHNEALQQQLNDCSRLTGGDKEETENQLRTLRGQLQEQTGKNDFLTRQVTLAANRVQELETSIEKMKKPVRKSNTMRVVWLLLIVFLLSFAGGIFVSAGFYDDTGYIRTIRSMEYQLSEDRDKIKKLEDDKAKQKTYIQAVQNQLETKNAKIKELEKEIKALNKAFLK